MQARGQRFESVILHSGDAESYVPRQSTEIFDILAKETNRSNEDTVREQKAGCVKLESNVSFYNFETRDEKVK